MRAMPGEWGTAMRSTGIISYYASRFKENRLLLAIQLLFLGFCMFSLVWFLRYRNNLSNITSAIGYSLVFLVPYGVEYLFRFKCPQALLVFVYVYALFCFLGEAYNLYTIVKPLDVLMHAFSGLLSGLFGYMLATAFIDPDAGRKQFFGCLFIGLLFSVFVSTLWEFYEFLRSLLTGMDHEEDAVIHSIHSFALSGTHDYPLVLDRIVKTRIYYDGGERVYEIGGYLDIGLYDTLSDMISGTFGGLLSMGLGAIRVGGRRIIVETLYPRLTGPADAAH